ncbi:hypothetical protein Q7P37_005093 [Cladosporium fusiforme]
MATFNYALAKTLLTEVEKERIVCTFLNSTDPIATVDWVKATEEFGSASIEAYKKGLQNTTKKLKAAMDEGVEPEAAAPAGTKKGGKKRKAAKATEEEADGDEVQEAPKKKGKKAKKTAVKLEEGVEDED